MRIKIFLTVCLIQVLGNIAFGEIYVDIPRYKTNFANETLPSIEASGRVSLYEVTVTGSTEVNGHISITKSHLYNLTANGTTNIEESTIDGLTIINGALNAVNSTFSGTLTIASASSYLQQSTAQDVFVRRILPLQTQTLYLSKNSQILGTITFENGNGEVVLDNSSSLIGEVMGGKIINH